MFSPTLAVLLQLLLLLKATNAQGTAEAPSVTSSSTTRKSTTKPTTSAPKTSTATTMTTAALDASVTKSSQPNCAQQLTSGELAGIVVVVIIIYVLSLLLTAFLVSHYTKKGTLDLDKLIFNRLPFLKKGRNARDPVNLPHSQEQEAGTNEYMETRPSSVYMGLERRDPDHSPTDDSMYTALQDVDRRLPSTNSSEQPAASNNLAVPPPKEGRKASSPSPTTPKPRGHKEDETESKKPNTKPKIVKEKPKTKTVNEDAVYQNASSMKL